MPGGTLGGYAKGALKTLPVIGGAIGGVLGGAAGNAASSVGGSGMTGSQAAGSVIG